jgi:hypothetical protein
MRPNNEVKATFLHENTPVFPTPFPVPHCLSNNRKTPVATGVFLLVGNTELESVTSTMSM